MSRIGKKPIEITKAVKVAVDANVVNIEGPKGKLSQEIPKGISVVLEGDHVLVKNEGGTKSHQALHGLLRSLLANCVEGVEKGFRKDLQIEGVGFKAAVEGSSLRLNLGFSHPIIYPIPGEIKVSVKDNTQIGIEGIDKQKVGAVAADIRRFYPPEPYKGKGVRFVGEQIRRKQGKTAQSK